MDPAGDRGRCVPGGLRGFTSEVVAEACGLRGFTSEVVPEASPEILESPTRFPIVDLGGARLISWAPARLQELLPKSGLGGRRGQSPLSPHRDFG